MSNGKSRRWLTLEERVKIIEDSDTMSQRQLSHAHSVSIGTINKVLKKRDELMSQFHAGAKKDTKRIVHGSSLAIDHEVLAWFQAARANQVCISGRELQAKALEIAKSLGLHEFKASNGWLHKFQRRHDMRSSKKLRRGESAEVRETFVDLLSVSAVVSETDVHLLGESAGVSEMNVNLPGESAEDSDETVVDLLGESAEVSETVVDDWKRIMECSGRSNIWLYAHPSQDELANKLVNSCQGGEALSSQTLSDRQTYSRQVSQRLVEQPRSVEYQKNQIQWRRFPDGFPNLFIHDVKHMAGKDIIFLASFDSPEVIFDQLSVMYSIPRYMARSFTIILPYFPTGTMERVDTEGQIATAKTLARLLSSIPLTARGPAQIIVFDIHSLQSRFYFSENVIPRLLSAIPLLQRELKQRPDYDELAYAFPDDGAFKRFHSMFPDERSIVCAKVRDKDKRVVTVKDGDPRDRHVIIVDDLVMTGGTLKHCAQVLLQKGAKSVSAFVTHAVFPANSWRQFTDRPEEKSVFANFWITDTLPHASEICQHKPFTMLSVSHVVADTLLGYDLLQ